MSILGRDYFAGMVLYQATESQGWRLLVLEVVCDGLTLACTTTLGRTFVLQAYPHLRKKLLNLFRRSISSHSFFLSYFQPPSPMKKYVKFISPFDLSSLTRTFIHLLFIRSVRGSLIHFN